MNRGLGLRALVLSFALGSAILGIDLLGAEEPGQKVVRVGVINQTSSSTAPVGYSAFWQRLRELGYVERENLVVEARWADNQLDRLPALTTELLVHNVDVLAAWGTPAAIAAKKATTTVPIVAVGVGDPIGAGLVTNLARPSGNVTGVSWGYSDIAGKWLELLKETVPRLSVIAVIANPDNPVNRGLSRDLEAMAPARHFKLRVIEVRNQEALDRAFQEAQHGAQAVLVLPDLTISADRQRLTALATRHRLPAVYPARSLVDAGGLMSYAPDFDVANRRAADYVDKILRGAKPTDLPVEQPTQYQLVVNLKTAKALGITIPESILQRADEVIR